MVDLAVLTPGESVETIDMNMNPGSQWPLVHLLSWSSSGASVAVHIPATITLLFIGVRTQVTQVGTLLTQRVFSAADCDHEHQHEQRHHNSSDHCSDHNNIGVRDVLENSDTLDINLTGNTQSNTVVDEAVICSEALLLQLQSDGAGHLILQSSLAFIALITFLPSEGHLARVGISNTAEYQGVLILLLVDGAVRRVENIDVGCQ